MLNAPPSAPSGVPPRLALGTSDFAKLREPGVLLVDKSDLIRRVLTDPYETLLFPRPRRFGKSTNLSMLGYFLGKSEVDHSDLFHDLSIWRSAEARSHFQRYPLIYLTFKDLKGASGPECLATLRTLRSLLMKLFIEHGYLPQGQMAPGEAAVFKALSMGEASTEQCRGALQLLSRHLHRHHGQKAVILIDEYGATRSRMASC